MAQGWHSVIDKEMASVNSVIKAEVTTAYPELNEMRSSIITYRGHDVIPALCILSYYANGGKDEEAAVSVASCFGAVFDGLHMHDSVGADGKVKGAKKKFYHKVDISTTKTIVAGDYMYIMGFRKAYRSSPGVVPYLMAASSSMSNGIFTMVDSSNDPAFTEEVCIKIMESKDAAEFRFSMESACKEAGSDEAAMKRMAEIGHSIGMACRLAYDVEDLYGSDGSKPALDTLSSGRPTFPLRIALDSDKTGALAEMFKGAPTKDAQRILSSVKDEVLNRTRAKISDYKEKAKALIGELADSEYRAAISSFLDSVVV